MRHIILLILLVAIVHTAQAQAFKLSGKITNHLREPIAFVSVQAKDLQLGTTSKEDGSYALQLDEGKYDIIFSIVGYKPRVITLVLTNDYLQNITLEEDKIFLQDVSVTTRYKDPATDLIKQVISRKDSLLAATGAWTCMVYIKGVQQDTLLAKPKQPVKDSLHALSNMAMKEVILKLDYVSEAKFKEERIGIKEVGKSEDIFFLSSTEGFFNFYNNLIKVPGLSAATFVSPVSYSGLLAYRYKTLYTKKRGNYKWYTIGVKARLISNATVEGELTINDSSFSIEHCRFNFPKYHLPQYDAFTVEQWFSDTLPLLHKQQFTYGSKVSKRKMSGITTVAYKGYKLHQQFAPNYFGTEVSATTAVAYKQDSSFWVNARAEPLTSKEIALTAYRDSIYRATHTSHYLDSIDRLTNAFTWKKLLLSGQTFYSRPIQQTWYLPPVPALIQPFAFGGVRITPGVSYLKVFPSLQNLSIYADVSYGLRNKDVNGSLRFSRMYNPFNRGFYGVAIRRDFEFIFEGDAWINLLKRSNLFLNNALSIYHGIEVKNGLFVYTDFDIALRRSLEHYKTGNTIDSLFGNALGNNNNALAFEPYNALYGKIRIEYTPFQRYIRQPKEKIILGSAWPTFYATYRKGISGLFSSKADFDFLETGLRQEISTGLLGKLRYNVNTGTFLNRRNLQVVDYQFQRRGDPLFFLNPDLAFQKLDSSFPLFNRYWQGHFVHEFNGYFLNKVPWLKKVGLREVAGAGFLLAPERNLRYAETFIGVERVFKWPFNVGSKFKMGVYMVGSVANRFSNPVSIKIGFTSWDKKRNRWY